VEDPRKAKGIVKREVVRVVSPGTLTDASYLDAREPSYLMAITGAGPEELGVALIDLSTGEFTTAEYHGSEGLQSLADEISVLRPREIVLPSESTVAAVLPEIARLQLPITYAESWGFEFESARRTLLDQLKAHGLEGFGLDGRRSAIEAAGGLLTHLRATQKGGLAHVRAVTFKTAAACLIIDPITLKHLEIVTGSDGAKGSLLHEIDRTVTVMAGCGRGAGISVDRSRQVPRRAEIGSRPRAAGRARRAGYRRPSRSRRPAAVTGNCSPDSDGAERMSGAAVAQPDC
jgi:DNA mismatch repair protein MutS